MRSRLAIEGWFSHDTAENLFRAAGLDLAEVDGRSRHAWVPSGRALGMHAKLTVNNRLRMIDSHNVIARLTGSDAALKDSYVIYTAHWDHFGVGPEVKGDRIYHGAVDNASGTAALLEIARAYKQLRIPPKRSILFLSVTAEEQGLLGSRYYAEHPLYPLARTVMDINMDGMNVHGRTNDIVMIGKGNSTLDELVASLAGQPGARRQIRDPEPGKGLFLSLRSLPALPSSGSRLLTRTRVSISSGNPRAGD